jgi:hypothetical protein
MFKARKTLEVVTHKPPKKDNWRATFIFGTDVMAVENKRSKLRNQA